MLFRSASAQVPPPAVDREVETTLDADLVRDLPTGDSLFALLEATQPSIVSDRFSSGGLYAGQAARVGGFSGSWTQTLFRLGDVTLSDPTGSGAPLLFPDPTVWQRVRMTTGSMPLDINAAGLAVTLEPLAPTSTWVRTVTVGASHGALSGAAHPGVAPAIDRLDAWDRTSATATGPLTPRLGGAFAASWTRGSQLAPSDTAAVETRSTSAYAHLVFTGSGGGQLSALGWVQRSSYPFPLRRPFATPAASTGDDGVHAQVAGASTLGPSWRVRSFAAYTQRSRDTSDVGSTASFERLLDGPPALAATVADSLVRQWTAGVRLLPSCSPCPACPSCAGRAATHTFEAGFDLSGASVTESRPWTGTAGELVDGTPARVWRFSNQAGESIRSHTLAAAYVTDHIQIAPPLSLEAGVRFDSASGAASAAANGIQWHTWLPRATLRWLLSERSRTTVFAGYSRSAYRLHLDLFAIGDPAASVAKVFRWDAATVPLGSTAGAFGPLVARSGPGTGGDPNFTRIDPRVNRPYVDELMVGIQRHPSDNLRLLLVGIARWERNLLALANVGAPASSYSVMNVADPGLDLVHSDDDQLLPVYNRLRGTFGQDRYVLTNASATGASSSIEASGLWRRGRLMLAGGATANMWEGPAANRGFGPLENDDGVLGELSANPNAATFARGRLFTDRAFTIKLMGTYQLPREIRVGAIARYQDGQPFSRMVVVPGLDQGVDAVRAFPSGGSRFMFTATLDVRVQKSFSVGRYRFDAIIDAFNLTNRADEVEERVVTGPQFRTVAAVQPPRAVHIGARMTF